MQRAESNRVHQSFLHPTILFCILISITISTNSTREGDFYQDTGVTAAEILRHRGYFANEFYVTTASGYVLRLTRGRNPLIEGGSLAFKDPVVFIHGVLASASGFLLNSFDAKPNDFTSTSLKSTDLNTLIKQFAAVSQSVAVARFEHRP